MSVSANFRLVSRLGLVTAGLMFALIVLGSIVRTTGSGLACPDWPLCHGRLIPPLQFNVLVEWFHRLVALLVSVMLAGLAGAIFLRREVRARLGALMALALVLLAVQILLGAFTVWRMLAPEFVSSHLAVALLLFSTLLTLTLLAGREAEGGGGDLGPRPRALLPLLGTAGLLIYLQAVLGGMVSSSHAGLACPDWPTCHGQWFPRMSGLIGLQMAHRWGAYLLVAFLGVLAFRTRTAADPVLARGGSLLVALTLGQIALGVGNVLLGLPVWLSAFHLANATGLLALALALAFRVASMRAVGRAPATATAAS